MLHLRAVTCALAVVRTDSNVSCGETYFRLKRDETATPRYYVVCVRGGRYVGAHGYMYLARGSRHAKNATISKIRGSIAVSITDCCGFNRKVYDGVAQTTPLQNDCTDWKPHGAERNGVYGEQYFHGAERFVAHVPDQSGVVQTVPLRRAA